MALSAGAEKIKAELQKAVALRRELTAMDEEWQDMLALEEESTGWEAMDMQFLHDLHTERLAVRKALAARQLRNLARLQHTLLTDVQRRVMRLRYLQCLTWGDLIERMGYSKQYVLREHNKALERLAFDAQKKVPKKTAQVS